jgi:hypothetical protein
MTPAEKIAEILLKHYEALRSEIQTLMGRGDFPNYAEQEWLIADGFPTSSADVLYFNDNQSAFAYACKFLDCTFAQMTVISGLVEQVGPTNDGLQRCRLRLSSDTGGRPVLFCTTINKLVPALRVGDLVAYFVAGIIRYQGQQVRPHGLCSRKARQDDFDFKRMEGG